MISFFFCQLEYIQFSFNIHTDSQHKVIIGVVVDVLQFVPHGEHKLYKRGHMLAAARFVTHLLVRDQTHCRHVRGPDGLYLVDGTESVISKQLKRT